MFLTLSTALLSCTLAAGAEPAFTIETDSAKRIQAELTLSFQYPKLKAREWVLFAAQLPELPGQTRVSSSIEPAGKTIEELSGLGRPVLSARIFVADKSKEQRLDAKIKYQADLLPRRLVRQTPGQKARPAAALAVEEQKGALAVLPLCDFKSVEFQRWLDNQGLRKANAEDDVEYARRVFLAIRKSVPYKYLTNQDRRVSQLVGAGGTDCGGMCLLFAAALRAGNIPARTLWGRWAESAKAGDRLGDADYYQTHVKAEFYARGIGWVPVDLASAVLHDKSREGLQYFGSDPGNFLAMHVDTDLTVDTGTLGKKTMPWLQGVHFWVTGSGPLEQGTRQESWQVRKLP